MSAARGLVSLSLSDEVVLRLLDDPALAVRLDVANPAFVLLGAARAWGEPAGGISLDPTLTAAQVALALPTTGVVAMVAVHGDHPYNIARRVASLDQVCRGRAGLLFTARDVTSASSHAWGGDGLQPPVPLDDDTRSDAFAVLAALFASFPGSAVVADRATGTYVDAEQVRRIDHTGSLPVAGPLQIPGSRQGSPVLAVHGAGLAGSLQAAADLVVLDEGETAAPGGPAALLRVVEPGRIAGLLDRAAQAGAAGVLFPVRTVEELEEVLGDPGLGGSDGASAGSVTLRERLALPVRRVDTSGWEVAFPADQTVSRRSFA